MLLDATNKEQLIPINTGRGNTFVTIQKGQVIYGRFKYQENFLLQVGQTGIIDRILKRLEKVHKLVDRQTYSHYTVVTIKNYDVLTKMDRLIDRQCTGNRQAIDTYKSVKSVKTDKTVGLPNQKTTPLMEITYPSIYAICQETNIFPDTARAFLASLIKQVLADGVKSNDIEKVSTGYEKIDRLTGGLRFENTYLIISLFLSIIQSEVNTPVLIGGFFIEIWHKIFILTIKI